MSNAVKSLSAPLAQCVKHRSSNQTLTSSNLAAYPLFIFFNSNNRTTSVFLMGSL